MILADKIIRLRKKNGWSQEELANKLGVSRQAVSKWEAAQTVPDLNRILELASLFSVTTDYLLKDEIENEEYTSENEEKTGRKVSLSEANEYLALRKSAALKIAVGTFLCAISPVLLILLGGISSLPETGAVNLSGNGAGITGLCVLLVTVVAAVVLFILAGSKSADYAFLEKEPFETEYGVEGMVKNFKKSFRAQYMRYNIIGICLCILSPIPLFISALSESELLAVAGVCVLLVLAGSGAAFFVNAGVRNASMERLLKEGEFEAGKKEKTRLKEGISTVYWLVVTAIYLGVSFSTNEWKSTWIIWAVSGIIYAVVINIVKLIIKDND